MLAHSSALDALGSLRAGSVDAVITDPPYGLEFLGADWVKYADGAPTLRTGYQHAATNSELQADRGHKFGRVAYGKRRTTYRCEDCGKRDAMRIAHGDCDGWRQEWVDAEPHEARAFAAWTQEWAAAALRVLKPGGYLVAFGAARTHHRAAIGIEEAGFELRDVVLWLYGTGHPKSFGVGRHLEAQGHPEAALLDGWGTALKPAYEPVILARKLPIGPLHESVVVHGVGALNIDGCRLDGERWPSNLAVSSDTATGVSAAIGAPASRLAYVAKPSTDERTAGLFADDELHPTVKPIDLMRYLVRLVCPPGGLVVDPFAGSGTTAIAAYLEGCRHLSIEHDAGYADLARRRIAWWEKYGAPGMTTDAVLDGGLGRDRERSAGQLDMFGA